MHSHVNKNCVQTVEDRVCISFQYCSVTVASPQPKEQLWTDTQRKQDQDLTRDEWCISNLESCNMNWQQFSQMKIDKLIEPSGKAPLFHQLCKSLCYSLKNNEMHQNEKIPTSQWKFNALHMYS